MRPWIGFPLLVVLTAEPSAAQIVLPGAAPPAPVGSTERPPPIRKRPVRSDASGPALSTPLKPIHVPSLSSIVGKPLLLNGSTSEVVFSATGALAADTDKTKAKDATDDVPLAVTRLTLTGELLSKPSEQCRLDVKPTRPIQTMPVGRPAGVIRLKLDLASCPFSFDVLDGAILPTKETQSCAFREADCQVNIGGLWGPRGTDIGPADIKDLERARAQADLAAREAFRDLLKRTSDKPEVKRVAAEQAGFSSLREETCRSYALESVHGFCGTRLTQARVTALQADLEKAPPAQAKRGHGKTARH